MITKAYTDKEVTKPWNARPSTIPPPPGAGVLHAAANGVLDILLNVFEVMGKKSFCRTIHLRQRAIYIIFNMLKLDI